MDSFASGVNSTFWSVSSNQALYSMDASNGDVRFSKPVGGSFSFQAVNLDFLLDLQGDFDAHVDFRSASINRVNGTPGNQIQLNAIFGSQYFAVVRADEVGTGNNVHVYRDPPQIVQGLLATNATSGRLRIARTGVTVKGYFDNTVLFTGNFNSNDVTRLWFSLQNNGTTDATSVTFDDFSVTADNIPGIPEPGTCALITSGLLLLGTRTLRRKRTPSGGQ